MSESTNIMTIELKKVVFYEEFQGIRFDGTYESSHAITSHLIDGEYDFKVLDIHITKSSNITQSSMAVAVTYKASTGYDTVKTLEISKGDIVTFTRSKDIDILTVAEQARWRARLDGEWPE